MVSPAFGGSDRCGTAVLSTDRSATCAIGTVTEPGGETTPPAVAVAVFTTDPASTSACVTTCEAVQTSTSPGSRNPSRFPTVDTNGHDSLLVRSSVTTTGPGSRTLPLFVTVNEYCSTCPTDRKLRCTTDFTNVSTGSCGTGTVTLSVPVSTPAGPMPEAVAVFTTDPAFRSAWVSSCEPVQVIDPPGGSVASGCVGEQVSAPSFGSVTLTSVRV